MSTVHWVGGEKGGVGKSVLARVLAQYFVQREVAFVGVDADSSHGALLRYYGDFTRGVDLESFSSTDQILDRALGAERRVLVDLPAQSARQVKRWMEATDAAAFAREMGVSMVVWHVTDGGFDSVTQLQRVLETFGASAKYVVVRNFGRSPDFSQLETSEVFGAVRELGGQVMDLPQLDSAVMYKIDRFGSSFWAAVNTDEGPLALSHMERRRAHRWLEQTYGFIDALGDVV